jgi:16S rRNA processing protein RimM
MEKLEIGKIVNTHGVRGELKCELWTDPEEVLPGIKAVMVGQEPRKLLGWRVHKNALLLKVQGVEDMDAPNALRGSIVWVQRDKVDKEPGYFYGDLFGFAVADTRTGRELGTLTAVEELPQGFLYVIETADGKEILIPARPEFTVAKDMENRRLEVRTIEGMLPDEN